MDNSILTKLRLRFVSDYNLPIQVVHSPVFEYYLNLYERDYKTQTKYQSLLDLIDKEYDGNAGKWLEMYYEKRNNIIMTILNNEPYTNFNERLDMKQYAVKNQTKGDNIYNESMVGKRLLSIDLKHGNFQALKFIGPNIVLGANTYEEMIGQFTDSAYIKESKYTRQVIFGKLNPSRQITVEKYIMAGILSQLPSDLKLISFKSDELIFEIPKTYEKKYGKETIEEFMVDGKPIIVKLQTFDLRGMAFKTHTDGLIRTYVKDYGDGIEELKNAPVVYYPQIYKAWKGLPLNEENDLYFYYEKQLAKFVSPIVLV